MTKKIIYTLFTLVIAFSSCTSKLDHEDDGRQTAKEIFGNRYKIASFYNQCVAAIIAPDIQGSRVTDEAQSSSYHDDSGVYNWYEGNITTSNFFDRNRHGGDPWASLYARIRRANVFLEHIDNETAGLVPDEKNGWKAEIFAMRSYYYWQLIKRYGDAPLSISPLQADHDFSKDTKTSFGEVVKQIVIDGEMALKTGPESSVGYPWNFTENLDGHLTKAGIHAIMSQALTYAVSPLWDDGTFTKEYATVITGRALSECLSHGYELFTHTSPKAVNAYANYFLNADTKRVEDKETIYRVGGRISMWNNSGLPSTSGQLNAGPCPTQNLVDAYEMKSTGLPAITGYSDTQRLSPVVNILSGYDSDNPYQGRDPRFYATVYYNGAAIDPSSASSRTVKSYVGGADEIRQKNKKYSPTGYYIRKFAHPDSKQGTVMDGSIRMFRLAELYLNFAETAYQAYGADQKIDIGNGINMSARDAVNTVRTRAGMPEIPAGLSKQDFEKRYRNERRVELAYEGHRYFDVRRWKILSETDTYMTGMEIRKNLSGGYTYNRFGFDQRKANTDKYLVFPINIGELNKIRKQTGENWQNAGWDY